LLGKFQDVLKSVEPFENEPLEAAMQQFLDREGIKIGDIIHTVRVAVTGKSVGPGLYDCLSLLGRESVLRRIERALSR
jgi:glutamyl-tRNA synthetase